MGWSRTEQSTQVLTDKVAPPKCSLWALISEHYWYSAVKQNCWRSHWAPCRNLNIPTAFVNWSQSSRKKT